MTHVTSFSDDELAALTRLANKARSMVNPNTFLGPNDVRNLVMGPDKNGNLRPGLNCEGAPLHGPIKPPLGVMPERIWRHSRSVDLSRAINEYLNGETNITDYKTLISWTRELSDHLVWVASQGK